MGTHLADRIARLVHFIAASNLGVISTLGLVLLEDLTQVLVGIISRTPGKSSRGHGEKNGSSDELHSE